MPLDSDLARDAAAFQAHAIVTPAPGIPVGMLCGSVVSLLVDRPDLPCLAVLDHDKRPVGVVERERLLSTFARQFMADLYRRRSIRSFVNDSFLAVDKATSIDEVGALIATLFPGALTGGFVVTEHGRYVGIGTGIGLLSKTMEQTRLRAHQLEAARLAAESANRAKSTFLASMSHEIRTPLNGVIGNLELLRYTDDAGERAELTVSASDSARTLVQLIGDVLDFSKAESDCITLEDGELDPAEAVRKSAELFVSRARQRGLRLDVHIGAGIPRRVRGDALRLRQIIMNFLANAVKFTENGRVVLEAARVWDAADGVRLRFMVTDTGIGFDPAKAEALFEPFTQENSSTTRRFGGTGLGLAICRKLIELMGGRIGAVGSPGNGATFWCDLPVTVIEEPAPEPAANLSGLRVLVFDGGFGNVAAVPLLRAAGATVVTATGVFDGTTALRAAEATGRAFDLAILDDPLRDGNGLVIAEALSATSTRLVLTAGADAAELCRTALRRDVSQILVRPFPPEELLRAAAQLCNRSGAAERPEEPVPAAAPPPIRCFAGQAGGLPVLVIDDTPMNSTVAQRQLAKLGLACEVAEDGLIGLRLAMAKPYALILVDGSMPVMDGYEFTRRFRAWEAERAGRTPVVAMTAHALADDVHRSLDAGMDDHLTKPVTIERLAAVLERWLPQNAPPLEPPVSAEQLASALGGLDEDEFDEILDLLITTLDPLLDRLDAALGAEDRTTARDVAHSAKGAALNVAAVRLGETLAAIEAAAPAGGSDDLRALTADARRELDRVRRFAEERLEKR